MKLRIDQAVLLVIDVQEKLIPVMQNEGELRSSFNKLIKGINALQIPVIVTEQYPQGLGKTIPEIQELLPNITPVEKRSFSCCQNSNFINSLQLMQRRQVLVCGIEAHVCVYQTCMDLLDQGFEVFLIIDAISSRKISDQQTAVRVMENNKIQIRSVEMLLFELIGTSEHPQFKTISTIIK